MISLRLTLIYSLILAESCFLWGCSTTTNQHKGNPALERRIILERYPIYESDPHPTNLVKLSETIRKVGPFEKGPVVTLLATTTPIAISNSGGEVFISRGLVKQLKDDGSLLFIIAHEYAHTLLNHHTRAEADASFEYEADAVALDLITRAGYPPKTAVRALTDAYGVTAFTNRNEISSSLGSRSLHHPSLRDRLLHLGTLPQR